MNNSSLIKLIRKPFRPLKRFYYQQKNQQEKRNHFKKYLRPTDLFLVGHPKSGNTWLALMLGVVIQKKFKNNITLGNVQEFIPAFHSADLKIDLYTNLPDPRIFRNEGPVYPELYPKTIYMLRDPRSVYVSYYRHCAHVRDDLQWKVEDFVDEMLTHGHISGMEPWLIRWDRQVSQWIERSKNQSVKIVTYEEMKKDRRKVLEDVLKYAGISCSEKEIEVAVERGSFNSMRKEEKKHGAEPYGGSKGEKGSFYVREGKTDGWKDELPQETSKKIESEFSEVMKKLDYL